MKRAKKPVLSVILLSLLERLTLHWNTRWWCYGTVGHWDSVTSTLGHMELQWSRWELTDLLKCDSTLITERAVSVSQIPAHSFVSGLQSKIGTLAGTCFYFAKHTRSTRTCKAALQIAVRSSETFFEVLVISYPGTPPASMWLANVTSCDHTSYCHFRRPMTPHRTFPEWTPTRMLISTPVASRTFLWRVTEEFVFKGVVPPFWKMWLFTFFHEMRRLLSVAK